MWITGTGRGTKRVPPHITLGGKEGKGCGAGDIGREGQAHAVPVLPTPKTPPKPLVLPRWKDAIKDRDAESVVCCLALSSKPAEAHNPEQEKEEEADQLHQLNHRPEPERRSEQSTAHRQPNVE